MDLTREPSRANELHAEWMSAETQQDFYEWAFHKLLTASPQAGAQREGGQASEVANILKEVCDIIGCKLGPGLARYVPLIARVRELAALERRVLASPPSGEPGPTRQMEPPHVEGAVNMGGASAPYDPSAPIASMEQQPEAPRLGVPPRYEEPKR